MGRVDNRVDLVGRVIKGPNTRYNAEGKPRALYQIQIEPRAKDKGMVQTPFIRSAGNQAEKDIANLKIGDVIIVSGRLVTRQETKTFYFVKDDESDESNRLRVYDPEDVDQRLYQDDEIYTSVITRPVTEVIADDVFYFSKFISKLNDEDMLRQFDARTLRHVLEDYRDDNGSIEPLIDHLTKEIEKEDETAN